MRTQIHPDKEHYVELDRRKLAFYSSVESTLPQRVQYPSGSEFSDIGALTIVPTIITSDGQNEFLPGERRSRKRKTHFRALFRSTVSLCPFLAIIFLLAGTPSVVLAQVQAENQKDPTMAPSVALTPAVPDPEPSETPGTGTAGTVPTTANAPVSATAPLMPTIALPPTRNPTVLPTPNPTISPFPTKAASDVPSSRPTTSFAPTTPAPTSQPTMMNPSLKETKFRQEFQVGNNREFNGDEVSLFQTIYQRYTVDFSELSASEVEDKITTICTVDKQTILFSARERQLQNDIAWSTYLRPWRRRRERRLEDQTVPEETNTLNVDYTMSYKSRHYDVTEYPKLFQNWTTNNLDVVLEQMQFLNFDVISVDIPKRIVVSTPSPTVSPAPSAAPSYAPTITPLPTANSTNKPTPTDAPTSPVVAQGFGSFNIIIIAVSVIIAISIIATGLFLYYRKRRTNQEDSFGPNASKRSQARSSEIRSSMRWVDSNRGDAPNPSYGTSETKAYGSSYGRHSDVPSRLADAISSPPGSLVSSQSLISRGNSMGGDSREEEDAAHTLVDEFDQYKDQNLEKMRAEIEDLPECDGMMSQAVAKALIDQDDESFTSSSYWGGDHELSAPEIEASALGFVLDWLKRNGQVSDREK